MDGLIKIKNHNGERAVSARDLYNFLGASERFSNWIDRQFQYGFIEGQDYIGCKEFNTLANQELTDYVLTLDCAKEISMLQKSDKGKQARQYFIECEKKLKNPYHNISKLEALKLAVAAEEKVLQLQEQINKQAPKINFLNRILDAEEKIDIGQAAKILELPFGRNTLFKKLREKGVFFKNRNEPRQEYVSRGYFQLKEKMVQTENREFMVIKVLVTQKGLAYISSIFGLNTEPKKQMALLN